MTSMDAKIAQCEAILGYDFDDKVLCATALVTCRTLVWVHKDPMMASGNGRLAVLGDSVMAATMCQKWYENIESKKGTWDSVRQTRLSNSALARIGFEADLDKCLHQNAGTGQVVSQKTMATAVEAILGAVHCDGGADALTRVMAGFGFMDDF